MAFRLCPLRKDLVPLVDYLRSDRYSTRYKQNVDGDERLALFGGRSDRGLRHQDLDVRTLGQVFGTTNRDTIALG